MMSADDTTWYKLPFSQLVKFHSIFYKKPAKPNRMMLLRLLVICLCTGVIGSQQQYLGKLMLGCDNNDETIENRLYFTAQRNSSCSGYLIYKAMKLYNSVQTISDLMSVSATELARLNNVSMVYIFEIDKEVIVPVKCFSIGKYYQANTTYTIPKEKSTYFLVASETYQGLATCNAVKLVNPYGVLDLAGGMVLQVPMRCACPSANQTAQGVRFLLTYSINKGDSVLGISKRFHVTRESLLDANKLSDEDIFPFTTLLIPLKDEPLSSWTIIVQNKTQDHSKNRFKLNKLYIGVGVAVGSSLAVCVALICIGMFLHRKSASDRCRRVESEGDLKLALRKEMLSEIASYDRQSFRIFEYEELKLATDNFSSEHLIKGSVYIGEIKGRSVTIKRLRTDVSKEVNVLRNINHFSLAQLYGICIKHGCSYLIYEYLENGCLQEWLKNENSRETGKLTRRIQIALDIANGLHYLHNFIEPAYVHKDITSKNILLDKDLRAKITNFSLGKIADKGTRHVSSTVNIVGTRGYMAPEYLSFGIVTTKLDVYAFGVLLLELLTGKDAVTMKLHNEVVLLKEEVVNLMGIDNGEAELAILIDPRLKGNATMLFAAQVLKLSVACVEDDPASRPGIDEVVSFLHKIQAEMVKIEISSSC